MDFGHLYLATRDRVRIENDAILPSLPWQLLRIYFLNSLRDAEGNFGKSLPFVYSVWIFDVYFWSNRMSAVCDRMRAFLLSQDGAAAIPHPTSSPR